MKLLLLSVCCIATLNLHSQEFYFSFNDLSTVDCYDSEESITTFEGWEFYQTLDNTWDGERDSSICINVQTDGWVEYFVTSDADLTRPVFVRALLEEGILLNSNSLNHITSYLSSTALGNLDYTNTEFCNNGFCCGLMMGVEVPSNPVDTTDYAMRWYINNINDNYIDFCIPTEYFIEGNTLKEVIFKFILVEDADTEFPLFGIYSEDMQWFVNALDSASILEYNSSQFNYQLMDYEENSFLVMYQDTTQYPSIENVSFLDVYPVPNVGNIENIELEIGWESSINFQAFSYLRGGLIDGSDSIRHTYSLINKGANICMMPYVDMPLESGNSYVHHSGTFDMMQGSCLMLKSGSSLIVEENSYLHYGQQKRGVLAMFANCNIVLKKNSKLEISNKIALWDKAWSEEDQIVEIHLPPYTELVFSDGASIDNKSTNERTNIHIYMEGGKLDLSGFNVEDMKHIQLIYPELEDESTELVIIGNPINSVIRFSFRSSSWQALQGVVYSMDGKQVHTFNIDAQKGMNYLTENLSDLSSGSYILSLSGESFDHSTLFIKGD